MLVLFESSAGYVLFKADDGKLKRAGDDIHEAFEAGASDMVSPLCKIHVRFCTLTPSRCICCCCALCR